MLDPSLVYFVDKFNIMETFLTLTGYETHMHIHIPWPIHSIFTPCFTLVEIGHTRKKKPLHGFLTLVHNLITKWFKCVLKWSICPNGKKRCIFFDKSCRILTKKWRGFFLFFLEKISDFSTRKIEKKNPGKDYIIK